MSDRLYYTDPFQTTFTATVRDEVDVGPRPAVVLDRTAFYPTSGGQPFDTGFLNDVPVLEVVELDDGRVAHVLERSLTPGTAVEARIDWPRRFGHMQQHTGQHVLSAAFERLHQARTVGFHLGAAASTIDLSIPMGALEVTAAERDANRVVWEDRPVHVRFVGAEEAARLPLRKEPTREGTLRLVEVDDYDLSACGGTHVARTGAIGLIAVAAFERFKGGTRVEFLCGGRALARFRTLRDTVAGSVRALSVLPEEVPSAIERMQADARAQRQAMRALQERLAGYEAAALADRAEGLSSCSAVLEVIAGADAQALKPLAAAIAARDTHVAVLIGEGSPRPIVIARGRSVPIDAAAILRGLTAKFGGRGGGRPELAQGGGLAGTPEEILAAARELLR
jgi:alanyl-tRNA synthetase